MIPPRISDRLVPIPDTGCMLWEGSTDRKGYATVWFQGKRRRLNRVLFKLRTGRWPRRDREMLHSCITPQCCAEGPGGHVSEGTRKRNARERHAQGRTRGLKQCRHSKNLRIYPVWTIRMPGHERSA